MTIATDTWVPMTPGGSQGLVELERYRAKHDPGDASNDEHDHPADRKQEWGVEMDLTFSNGCRPRKYFDPSRHDDRVKGV